MYQFDGMVMVSVLLLLVAKYLQVWRSSCYQGYKILLGNISFSYGYGLLFCDPHCCLNSGDGFVVLRCDYDC